MPETYALRERAGKEGGGKGPLVQVDVSGTLTPSNDQRIFHKSDDIVELFPLEDENGVTAIDPNDWIVRGLTPVECERLQGFDDGHTDLAGEDPEEILARIPLPEDGKKRKQVERNVRKWCAKCPDGPRYKACGNSMAVPVIEWLGQRIEMVDELVIDLMLEGEL